MGLRESARAVASRGSADVVGGRYRLDRLLGSGGAADVHQGFDLRLRRPVAVKVFRPGTGVDIEHDAQREAVLLARLRHPGLVAAYDAGQDDTRAFLVMELIEGTTLRGRIAQGPLTAGETAALGRDVARALAHAHEAGVVHRDVKPSNILLDASRRPYLTDFGISRLLDATSHTATGTLTGTAAYLSPEQVLGRPVGCPADIYALGLVVLECLTGRLEYGGGPLESAIARLHRPPDLPSGLPRQLADLVEDMTALDEGSRPDADRCARVLAAVAVATADHAPAAPVTPAVTRPETLRTAERTHAKQTPAAEPSVPPARTGRARVLLASAAALSTAALATALVVTDQPAPPGPARASAGATASSGRPEARPLVTDASPKDTARARTAPRTGAAPPVDAADRSPRAAGRPSRDGAVLDSKTTAGSAGAHGGGPADDATPDPPRGRESDPRNEQAKKDPPNNGEKAKPQKKAMKK